MRSRMFLACAGLAALAACGGGDDATTANEGAAADTLAMNSDGNVAVDDVGNAADPASAVNGQDYAARASASDLFEIQSGQLAQEKAQDPDVKALAAMLVTDHRKSTADLKAAAAKAQPAIDVAPALDSEQQANMDALRAAAPADFDRTFLTQQIAGHEKALTLVRNYANGGDVEALKQHAAKVAGPVEMHLNRARDLSQRSAKTP
jgi:putative membrane protein